jgi:hypothetical protein
MWELEIKILALTAMYFVGWFLFETDSLIKKKKLPEKSVTRLFLWRR